MILKAVSRRFPRYHATYSATIRYLGSTQSISCKVADLSENGCSLMLEDAPPEGALLELSFYDSIIGQAIQLEGFVARVPEDDIAAPSLDKTGTATPPPLPAAVSAKPSGNQTKQLRIGIQLETPPPIWLALVNRYREDAKSKSTKKQLRRLTLLVAGDSKHKREALALYVKSGWDVRFALDYEAAAQGLREFDVDAVVSEHDSAEARNKILELAKRLRPKARRVARYDIGGGALPGAGLPTDLVHDVVDSHRGLDALVTTVYKNCGPDSAKKPTQAS